MDLFIPIAVIVASFFFGFWLISLPLRNASIIDVAWGAGFALVVWASAGLAGSTDARTLAVGLIVTLWAIRLSVHLGLRQWREGKEDARYAAMRANHPDDFALWSLRMVFAVQAVALFVIALPLTLPPTGTAFGSMTDIAGLMLALFGLGFETIADVQLARHRARGTNEVLSSGLWAWSRHPNYFGEAVFWWGIFLLAVPASGAWWMVISPLAITFLLVKVSGVPVLERGLKSTRPGYDAYITRTSSFIPLPPKRLPH